MEDLTAPASEDLIVAVIDDEVSAVVADAVVAEAIIDEATDVVVASVLAEGLAEAEEIVETGEEEAELIAIAAAGDGVEQAEIDAEVEAVVEEAVVEAMEVVEEAVEEALEVEVAAAMAIEEIEEAVEEVLVEAAVVEAVVEAEAEAETEVEEEEEPTEEEIAAAEAELAKTRSPFDGPGDWYVVHTYSGYENRVKTNLMARIHTMQMQDKIFGVEIPMEDVMEIKGGKKQVVKKKVFPGYLLVSMIYDNDSWYVVRNTPGVTGFVSAGTGTKPTPLSRREVEKILMVKEEETKPVFRLEWEEGDVVRIISGPFADFNGTISEINVDQSKLKVLVNIFDRETPVELGFDQVAKV